MTTIITMITTIEIEKEHPNMEADRSFLNKHGVKPTQKRLFVFRFLRESQKAYSISELYSKFRHQQDRVTIYRTILLLCESRIIVRFSDQDGILRYRWASTSVMAECKLSCQNCGKVEKLPKISIPNEYLVQLENYVSGSRGVVLTGLCTDCTHSEHLSSYKKNDSLLT